MSENLREGSVALLSIFTILLVVNDTLEEGKVEFDAVLACLLAGLRKKRMLA